MRDPNGNGKVPSPAEIRRACLRIQKRWSAAQRDAHGHFGIEVRTFRLNGIEVTCGRPVAGHSQPYEFPPAGSVR